MLVSFSKTLISALATIFLFAQAVFAAETQPATEVLTIHGHAPTDAELTAAITAYVDDHAALSPVIDQISRWIDAPCLHLQNLDASYAKIIVDRVKAVGTEMGLPMRNDCQPNVEIFFTTKPQAFLDAIVEKLPLMLGFHAVAKTKEIAQVKRPIQAWYTTSTKVEACVEVDETHPSSASPCGNSKQSNHMSNGAESIFSQILMVVNIDGLPNIQLGAIADYIAMVTLSKPQNPDRCGDLPSILDLSQNCGGPKPGALTIADTAYLKGLYGMNLRAFSSLQKGMILAEMKKTLGSSVAN